MYFPSCRRTTGVHNKSGTPSLHAPRLFATEGLAVSLMSPSCLLLRCPSLPLGGNCSLVSGFPAHDEDLHCSKGDPPYLCCCLRCVVRKVRPVHEACEHIVSLEKETTESHFAQCSCASAHQRRRQGRKKHVRSKRFRVAGFTMIVPLLSVACRQAGKVSMYYLCTRSSTASRCHVLCGAFSRRCDGFSCLSPTGFRVSCRSGLQKLLNFGLENNFKLNLCSFVLLLLLLLQCCCSCCCSG